LLAKGEVFEHELSAGAEGETQRSKKAYTQAGHEWSIHEVDSHRPLIIATVGKHASRMASWRGTRLQSSAHMADVA
jgi:hypothetical protein